MRVRWHAMLGAVGGPDRRAPAGGSGMGGDGGLSQPRDGLEARGLFRRGCGRRRAWRGGSIAVSARFEQVFCITSRMMPSRRVTARPGDADILFHVSPHADLVAVPQRSKMRLAKAKHEQVLMFPAGSGNAEGLVVGENIARAQVTRSRREARRGRRVFR